MQRDGLPIPGATNTSALLQTYETQPLLPQLMNHAKTCKPGSNENSIVVKLCLYFYSIRLRHGGSRIQADDDEREVGIKCSLSCWLHVQ